MKCLAISEKGHLFSFEVPDANVNKLARENNVVADTLLSFIVSKSGTPHVFCNTDAVPFITSVELSMDAAENKKTMASADIKAISIEHIKERKVKPEIISNYADALRTIGSIPGVNIEMIMPEMEIKPKEQSEGKNDD